jgi:competence protein ComEA
MKNKEKIIGSVIILVLFIVFLFIGYSMTNNKKEKTEDIFVENESTPVNNKNLVGNKNAANEIKVEIKGAVKKPDVYTMNSDNIVLDLVKAAGGYNEDADKDSIIQATRLHDGDCIWVKAKGEVTATGNNVASNIVQNTSGKININTATKEQIMKLEGIGGSRADKIIKYREENGPYKSIEDLKKIGARIGDAIINNIKDKVEFR